MRNINFDYNRTFNTIRTPYLAEKTVFIDGLEGCGKTLFSSLVSSFDRVEKLTYSYEIEFFCTLHYLNKVDSDAVVSMVKMLTDLVTYDTMMSREVNFRPGDLSSVFRHPNTLRYIKRLFMKGDYAVPARIKKEQPIIPLTVHKLLMNAQPIFEALTGRLVFIEIVRHPLYMIIQQSLNNDTLIYTARDYSVYFQHGDEELPWYTAGWEELFKNANPVEKAIYYIQKLGERMKTSRESLPERYNDPILTIPFEKFVLDPMPYMNDIAQALDSKITKRTLRIMKQQKVPRMKISDGIPLEVYKRCGWVPPREGLTEKEELQVRREYALQSASPEAIAVLDQMSAEYEAQFMNNIL
jgi:hypothetical protein